ncbi:MAG: Holliday junction branch migration DNA helicase RuvB [Ignavibacteriales bacterium]|nr:Holliday junction branch migration DNA helicase RuvB [Ignavibacteriales bacterium]
MRKSEITTPEPLEEEREFDVSLRPRTFEDFIGQNKLRENLKIFVTAAQQRNEALDHVLLTGPPGLGKTTLANIIALELGKNIHITSGPVLIKPYDLAGILTNVAEHDIVFIDEIHRLNKTVEEYLYSAMEDFRLDIVLDSGPNARSVQLTLPKFTLVGATTRQGLLSAPLRSRFGINLRLNYYDSVSLCSIVERSAKLLTVLLENDSAIEIAKRSRGTPRIANRLLKRCRDFSEAHPQFQKQKNGITLEVAKVTLRELEVDESGLDEMDKRILTTIIEKFKGGPVGVGTVAAAVGEDTGTLEEVYEPYLLQEGFLQRTPRGREATDRAYAQLHLIKKNRMEETLFTNNE